MHVPNEIILAILEYVERDQLKTARLVCKTWSSYASGFLFDKIYVAPNRIDLEVFNSITQHPLLRKCVRQLVYDGSAFMSGLTKEGYIESLCHQTFSTFDIRTLSTFDVRESDPYADLQTKEWVHDVVIQATPLSEVVAKWKDHSFINRGYSVYKEHSVYQQIAIQSGEFVESLVQGLTRLVCLESVSLEGVWSFSARKSPVTRTPLARTWNPFHCIPHRWNYVPKIDDFEDIPDEMHHICIITTALGRAQRHIDEIAIGTKYVPGVCPKALKQNNPTLPNTFGLDIAVLSGIKRLHLHLADINGGITPGYCDNIEELPKILGSMHSLQQLDLDLCISSEDYTNWYTYDEVFPRAMTWNNLEKMILTNFASSATDLLSLLLIQMPHLRHVEIGELQLKGGRWESVIECLKQVHRFTTCKFDRDSILSHYGHDNIDFLECEKEDIEEYIMHGGRHPCLSDDQPASASEAYMLRIDASLRDRLLAVKSPRNPVAM